MAKSVLKCLCCGIEKSRDEFREGASIDVAIAAALEGNGGGRRVCDDCRKKWYPVGSVQIDPKGELAKHGFLFSFIVDAKPLDEIGGNSMLSQRYGLRQLNTRFGRCKYATPCRGNLSGIRAKARTWENFISYADGNHTLAVVVGDAEIMSGCLYNGVLTPLTLWLKSQKGGKNPIAITEVDGETVMLFKGITAQSPSEFLYAFECVKYALEAARVWSFDKKGRPRISKATEKVADVVAKWQGGLLPSHGRGKE